MSRIAYVNGLYLPHRRAAVHIEDRGYQFADGVYEVIAVACGRLIDAALHLDRLDRSLAELRIAAPMSRAALKLVIGEVLRRNRVRDGIIYIQVTRGVARREHSFPAESRPSLVMTARRLAPQDVTLSRDGVRVVTIPDLRWKRCDIKSISLTPNVLGKQLAREAGAFEAWQVDEEGFVTEGTSTNAWIVDRDGLLVTRPADEAILGGVTRRVILDLARELGLECAERAFTLEQAKAAREAFITGTTTDLLPVTRIDEVVIGDGRPGPLSRRLRERYMAHLAGPGEGA